ncbi:MAG: copper amine oxidase N-terminal domain-containing protein [Thermoanaerobacteraceae bacterium]|nr:copper amine oxidase N-terminal domain-containing protein [Thermoanaerobacteraceae bacterium]
MRKMEKNLERLEENGNVNVELLKKKFEARLEEINRKFEERIKLMQGRLRARGREIAFRDAFPVIKAGRTLIPVRAVTETLGAKVGWDPETSTITITRDDITIVINLGSMEYTVNGEVKTFDVPAQLINNRTFVPLRYIAEELGEKVSYDPETGDVNIGADELAEEEGEETAAETGGVATGETDENTGQINVEENQSNPEENTAQQTISDEEVTTQQ